MMRFTAFPRVNRHVSTEDLCVGQKVEAGVYPSLIHTFSFCGADVSDEYNQSIEQVVPGGRSQASPSVRPSRHEEALRF